MASGDKDDYVCFKEGPDPSSVSPFPRARMHSAAVVARFFVVADPLHLQLKSQLIPGELTAQGSSYAASNTGTSTVCG